MKNKLWFGLLFVLVFIFACGAVSAADADNQNMKPFKAAVVEFNPQLNERDKNIDELYQRQQETGQNLSSRRRCPLQAIITKTGRLSNLLLTASPVSPPKSLKKLPRSIEPISLLAWRK